jgi:hypothetical protein
MPEGNGTPAIGAPEADADKTERDASAEYPVLNEENAPPAIDEETPPVAAKETAEEPLLYFAR